MPQSARWFSLWGPPAFWCALIFVFSGIPDLNSGLEQDFLLRKLAHGLEYAVLMVLWLRASDGTFGRPPWRLAAACLFCALYAASDEFHQSFVPGRSGNAVDWVIDLVGVAGAAWWDSKWRPSL